MEEIEIEVELRDNTFLIDAEVDWHLMEAGAHPMRMAETMVYVELVFL